MITPPTGTNWARIFTNDVYANTISYVATLRLNATSISSTTLYFGLVNPSLRNNASPPTTSAGMFAILITNGAATVQEGSVTYSSTNTGTGTWTTPPTVSATSTLTVIYDGSGNFTYMIDGTMFFKKNTAVSSVPALGFAFYVNSGIPTNSYGIGTFSIGQQGATGPLGPSIYSIKPVNSAYNSSGNVSIVSNIVYLLPSTLNTAGTDPDTGGEWVFVTTPIVSACTVNFVVNFPNGYTAAQQKRIEVGLRRIRNTVGGTPGSDITQEVPTKPATGASSNFSDAVIDYSIYMANQNYMVRAAPLVRTTSTVFPASTLNNNTSSPFYGRVSTQGASGGYTDATASDLTNSGSWNAATSATSATTVTFTLVYTESTVSYFVNGTPIATKLGNSVPFITSAPVYAAIRIRGLDALDTVTMSVMPTQGPTGASSSSGLSLISNAATNALTLKGATTVSVIKSAAVNLDMTDRPFVVSANPLTGPFVLNFLFNTDKGASTVATDGTPPSTTSSAIEFAVGLVTSMAAREAFDGGLTTPMQYGLMVNTPTAGSPAAVYFKTDSTTFLTTLPSIATPTASPVNTAKLTNTASQTVPFGGNHSLQIRFDGTNMFFYVDGAIILPTTTLAGQTHTFAPTNKGPYYLVMSFANSNQFSSVPSGLLAPPTNFDLEVTMNDLFAGPSIMGAAIQIQQYTIMAQTLPNAVPAGVNTPSVRWAIDTPNSSSASEISYVDTATPAAGVFTYRARDGSSRAMVNLIMNVMNSNGAFSMRYIVFPGQPATTTTPGPRTVGPWIQSQGTTLTMKVSFLMTHLDSFILQMWTSSTGTLTGTLVVEKLPVASGGGQEGGGSSGLYRNIQVYPIPKRGKHKSLRVRKASTKAGTKKKNK